MAKKSKTSSSATTDRATLYALDVVEGREVAGPNVRNACRRHLKDLEDAHLRGFHYDEAEAVKVIRFFETKLRLNGGQFEGLPFKLHPAQAFKVGSLFGWKRADGTRRFRRAYIEEGKGNGKSPFAAGVGLYGMTADGEAGAEIYPLASHRDQAMVLFRDAVKMVRYSPDLAKRLSFSGGEGREYNIAWLKTGSFMRPLSRDAGRTGSGPRPHFGLADEVHELADRGAMEMVERGFKFRRQPLLLMITNSGTDRNSVAWEEHEHAVKVAAGNHDALTDPTFIGEPIDDTTFSYVCSLDDGDDPLTDPSCWKKANPLLGVTITEEYLAGVVKQAKDIPGKLNGILRLHFCVWTDAETAWMTRATLEPCIADFEIEEHKGESVYLGLDLSQNRDITALGAVVRTGENGDGKPLFDAWIEAWTPGDTLGSRELRDKLPYAVWAREGHIHTPPGESISYLHVAQRLVEYSREFEIPLAAYDRFAFKRFEEDAQSVGLDLMFVEHPQGGVKKGKALDGMVEGLWMPGSIRLLEDALLEKRIRLKRNPVLISAMMSAVTEEDRWGNHWLAKTRSVNKIDAAIALAMALGAAMAGDTGRAVCPWDDPNFSLVNA
jgi:phage terminase large subunit-like protein